MSDELEMFYKKWQNDRVDLIDYDNQCAARKVDVILQNAPVIYQLNLKSVIDFGCGRGKALSDFYNKMKLENGYGFDFSEASIEYAVKHYGSNKVQFQRLTTLDIDDSVEAITSAIGGGVDCILLLDLLEHVPDCKKLILRLSEITKYFVIKLPVEDNFLNNYFLKKIYPSTKHYNGHLREFNANSVFYFVRALGLTPLSEGLYLYDPRDTALQTKKLSLLRQFKVGLLGLLRKVLGIILPLKIFIRVCGPGGYYCVATFDNYNVLNP